MGIIENTLGACLARLFVKKGGTELGKTDFLEPAGQHSQAVSRHQWGTCGKCVPPLGGPGRRHPPQGASGSGGTSFEGPSGLCSKDAPRGVLVLL